MPELKTVENQKIIIVSKEAADKDHPYTVINLAAMKKALAELKNSEYKIWCYLAMNQNKYQLALSCVATCRETGISAKTFHNTINSLEDKGYLVRTKEGSNIYMFYELPSKDTDPKTSEDKIIYYPESKVKTSSEFVF